MIPEIRKFNDFRPPNFGNPNNLKIAKSRNTAVPTYVDIMRIKLFAPASLGTLGRRGRTVELASGADANFRMFPIHTHLAP